MRHWSGIFLQPLRRWIVRQIEQLTEEDRKRTAAVVEVQLELEYASTQRWQAAEARLQELQSKTFAIERLLTGTAAARPPGAAQAVVRLDEPAVAIVLPTYNRAKFVGEAIKSILNQSFINWELVIVDDGSSDETRAAVAPYLLDKRIRYLWKQNGGGPTARNLGIESTSAALIAYLDDDNLWYPDFLARAVDCMATEPDVEVLYGALVTYHHELQDSCILWQQFDRKQLLSGNYIDTNVIVHRRSRFEEYGGWDASAIPICDWDLVLRYTADKPARALDVLGAYYRSCDDQRITVVHANPEIFQKIQSKWQHEINALDSAIPPTPGIEQ